MTNIHVVHHLKLLLVTWLLLCLGCVSVGVRGMPEKAGADSDVKAAIPQTQQLLVVVGEGQGSSLAKLFFLERKDQGWGLVLGPVPATTGRNGFADPGAKREGDGKTPSGLFELEHVFGYAPSVATAMPYRQATEDDIWVDDPESPDYNKWVKKGSTTASSFERMKLPDHRYRHGIVIGYNRNPVVKGMGSAIFLHVWDAAGKSTAGCVALDEAQLVRIISLLDPAKKPMILMGDREYISTMVSPESFPDKTPTTPEPNGISPLSRLRGPERFGVQARSGRAREGAGFPAPVMLASLAPGGVESTQVADYADHESTALSPFSRLRSPERFGAQARSGMVGEGEDFAIQKAVKELDSTLRSRVEGKEVDKDLRAAVAPAQLAASGSDDLELYAAADSAAAKNLEQEIRAKAGASAKPLVELRGKDGFFGMALPVPETVEQEMLLKRTWRNDCPVAIRDLNYLLLGFRDFDGKAHVGEMVVHRKLAQAVVEAFGDLYFLRFPIERMELIERYDGDDHRSMEANNTSAFNCREIAGRPGVFSNHSYGTAIDINPVQNPYVVPRTAALRALGWDGTGGKGAFLKKLGYPAAGAIETFCRKAADNCRVSPPNGRPFVDRSLRQPGLLVEGPALEAFTSRGFEWGGAWVNSLDYQHLEVKPSKLR